MKKIYESPDLEINQFALNEDILDGSRIPDDGEIDDGDIFA